MRPAASTPVAWMCPFGYGEIHTSRQAGGIDQLTAAGPARRRSRTGAPVAVEEGPALAASASPVPGPARIATPQPHRRPVPLPPRPRPATTSSIGHGGQTSGCASTPPVPPDEPAPSPLGGPEHPVPGPVRRRPPPRRRHRPEQHHRRRCRRRWPGGPTPVSPLTTSRASATSAASSPRSVRPASTAVGGSPAVGGHPGGQRPLVGRAGDHHPVPPPGQRPGQRGEPVRRPALRRRPCRRGAARSPRPAAAPAPAGAGRGRPGRRGCRTRRAAGTSGRTSCSSSPQAGPSRCPAAGFAKASSRPGPAAASSRCDCGPPAVQVDRDLRRRPGQAGRSSPAVGSSRSTAADQVDQRGQPGRRGERQLLAGVRGPQRRAAPGTAVARSPTPSARSTRITGTTSPARRRPPARGPRSRAAGSART